MYTCTERERAREREREKEREREADRQTESEGVSGPSFCQTVELESWLANIRTWDSRVNMTIGWGSTSLCRLSRYFSEL